MQRRRRAPREGIAEGEFRNVTFRVGARAYNALVTAAATEGASISAVCERMVEAALDRPAQPPADDLRTLIREEIRAALNEQREPEGGNHPMRPGYDFLRRGPSDWIV